MIGIVSYGTYIPVFRITTETIARVWQKKGEEIVRGLVISEKAVAAADEDTVTMAIEAGFNALGITNIKPGQIEVVLVGSESHPYAVNPTSTIVGDFLQIGNHYLAADVEFACKAGTAAIQLISGLIDSQRISYGLAIGADTAQSRPHDVLEYTSGAAGAAIILGKNDVAAKLLDFTSFSSDTPDFWRRDGVRFPSHAGRFTGQPAYFTHVMGAAQQLLQKSRLSPDEFNYCVFHMPNGRFPLEVARKLGFSDAQLTPSLVVSHIGNPYSASSLLGLAAVLDIALPGEKIFMVSYGSGAGSDGFVWEVTEEIISLQKKRQSKGLLLQQNIKRKHYIDYSQYLKLTHKI